MSFLEITRGDSPLLLAFAHSGTELPADIAPQLNPRGLALADTDWHIHRLYAGLLENVTTIRTRIHRYVIDVNRDPTGQSLYPGQNTTGLCPLTDFEGAPLYRASHRPDPQETERRRAAFHAPYHAAIEAEMARLTARHGFAILYDCHSIRSHIPFLFEGVLPDLNIGTNRGTTCAPGLESAVHKLCAASRYSCVLNGRFKGGWTTRHYGRPAQGWHALQMELAQSTYLETEAAPFAYDAAKAEALRSPLRKILLALQGWRPDGAAHAAFG